VLVEAMAEGVVPVAFSVGGVPEVVEHGEQGFLVEADDLTIMQHRLKELLDNELLRNSLAENGRGRAAFFSIENHVASIEALYQELLQHG
jgi:glycosyltransferase involved in cell wall biosynthesis